MELENSEINPLNKVKSANIIQRAFKQYKQRKEGLNNCENKQSLENTDNISGDIEQFSDDEIIIKEDIENLKKQTQHTIEEINGFYEKYNQNSKRMANLKIMLNEIDVIALRLKTLAKIDDCKKVRTLPISFTQKFKDKAKKQHDEHLKKDDSKWWQKFNFLSVSEKEDIS